jgi:hypothetical protein
MQPISAAFRAALATGYQIVSQAQVLSNGVPLGKPIALMDGTITADRASAQRNTVKLTIGLSDRTLIPTTLSDTLGPGGNEVAVSSGWANPATGLNEFVALGVFPITTTTITDTGMDLALTISGYDRSWVVSQQKFLAPYVVAVGTDLATAIVTMIASVYPAVISNIVPTGGVITTPATNFKEGDDPWAGALSLAQAGGYELYFDANGVLVGRPTPDPTTVASMWEYADSGGDAAPKTIARTLTREGISNHFTVAGSGTDVQPPIQANASDTNYLSGTYVGGRFGDIPTFISSSLITDVTGAQNAANTALQQSLGSIEQLVVTGAPAPMFEIDDVITVSRPRIYVSGLYVVDAVSTSLRHDGQVQLTLRSV